MLPPTSPRSGADSPANLGSDAAWFTGPSAFGELLILVALAVLVVSGIAVVVISVFRLLRSRGLVPWTSRGPVDPEAAGVLAVALVQQANVERWMPATVVRLATHGILTVVDDGPSRRARVRSTSLEFTGDPAAVKARAAEGDVDASLACALFDGAPTQGAQVAAGRTSAMTKPVLAAALSGLARARRAYVDDIHSVLRRWLMIGGVAGLVAGFLLAITVEPQTSSAFLASGVAGLLGVIALVARWRVPSSRSLNPDGLELRARSRPDRMFPTKVATTIEGEELAPWAVLFGHADVLRRYAQLAERDGAGPAWYRGDGAFTARGFTSCIGSISSTLGLHAATAATVLAAGGSAETMTRNYAIIDGWSHSGDGGGGGGGGEGGGGGGGDGGGGGGGGGGGDGGGA